MKYFIIAGEASGDLHAAQLIKAIRRHDADAEIQFLGGDLMAAEAGHSPIIHYRDMAYMGFIEVAKHLGSILDTMRTAKSSIASMRPDALILVDYPSFNLKMAKYAKSLGIPSFYFISPKVWAWKEYRVKDIKKYITELYSILPFEVDFFARHNYKVDYVGNPTVKEIAEARASFAPREEFCQSIGVASDRPIVAIVPGSRVKEIRDNLPAMLSAAKRFDCTMVIAGAPSIDRSLYDDVMHSCGCSAPVITGHTFELVHHAKAALVTSGTATLETAVLGTPQVVCYRMGGSKLVYWLFSHLLKVKFVSLPNLITNSEIIPEMLLHHCNPEAIAQRLAPLLSDTAERNAMLRGYETMNHKLGTADCADTAAVRLIDHISK